jgi:UDP-glucose 4-epimerase
VFNKVVVTGAAGFIGGHLCNRLEREGVATIIGIDSLRSGDWNRTPLSMNKIERDINGISINEWVRYLDGADAVFHLAAEKYNSSKSTPDKLIQTNVVATENLFRAAANRSVDRTVFTSSLYSYGSLGPDAMIETDVAAPDTLYGASKLMGEGMLRSLDREIGMSWNVARLFFIYGPYQHAQGGYKSVINTNFERLLKGERPVVFGDGNQSLDYVYIDDCVEALLQLATSTIDKQIVNVASGTPNSVNDLTAEMIRITESSETPEFGPADWTLGSKRVGDTHLMTEAFGWKAQTKLSDGLVQVCQWLKDNRDG